MADSKYERYIRNFPSIFRPVDASDVEVSDWLTSVPNPILNALLRGLSQADDDIAVELGNTKAQLFVRTASNQFLDIIASSLGVARPPLLGLPDVNFRQLIPPLSLRAKQIRSSFYNSMDAFWGPEFSRANIETIDTDVFDIRTGDELRFTVDNGNIQTIVIRDGDVTEAAATILELNNLLLDFLSGVTPEILTNPITGEQSIRLRTDTPGLNGSLEYSEIRPRPDAVNTIFPVGIVELINQDQRTVIYEITPNEVIIEIPAVIPSLARGLMGSHHLHEDATLVENWPGAFVFDPNGSNSAFTVTGQSAEILGDATSGVSSLTAGEVHPRIQVRPATNNLPTDSGLAIIGFGVSTQEPALVRYRGRASDGVIEIDPSFTFSNTHPSGTSINIVSSAAPFNPDRVGNDYPIYLTSSTGAREVILEILRSLSAAGVIVNFVVLAPDYKYLVDNPFLTDDQSPLTVDSEGNPVVVTEEGYKYLIDNPTTANDDV